MCRKWHDFSMCHKLFSLSTMKLNPHLPNGRVHFYQFDETISNFRGVWCTFFILFWIDIPVSKPFEDPGLGLLCLQKWDAMLIWAAPSEFVSSSIPSWQILTAHAQPFRGARDLAFCLKVPLDSLLVWASSGGSGETARMRRLAWTFAARIGDKYRIRLTRSIWVNALLAVNLRKYEFWIF